MYSRKIIITLTSFICAAAMVLQVSFLAGGSQTPCIEQQKNQAQVIVKTVPTSGSVDYQTYSVVEKIPDSNAISFLSETHTELKTSASGIDIRQEGNAVYSGASENATGNPVSSVTAFLALYEAGINNLNVYLVDAEDGLKEFMADFDDDLGGHHTFQSGIYYDETKQLIYGKDDTGVFALGFDFDYGQLTIYSAKDSWQRNLGFCRLYDVLSPIVSFNYKTVRIKFDYNNMDWMIQLWKGRYVITMGAEIGLYNKPKDRLVEFYDCVDDNNLVPMSLRLLKGDEVLFEKELQPCWWQTGFKLGELYLPFQLTLESTIVFPSETMRDCFIQAVDQLKFDKITYEVDGNSVSLVW